MPRRLCEVSRSLPGANIELDRRNIDTTKSAWQTDIRGGLGRGAPAMWWCSSLSTRPEEEARVAWTGNLVLGVGMPFLIEGGAEPYLETIQRFADALDVETIVSGHGPIAPRGLLDAHRSYLSDLVAVVSDPSRSGGSLETALAAFPVPDAYIPADADPQTRAFFEGLHAFNVWRALGETRHRAVTGTVQAPR